MKDFKLQSEIRKFVVSAICLVSTQLTGNSNPMSKWHERDPTNYNKYVKVCSCCNANCETNAHLSLAHGYGTLHPACLIL